MESGEDMVRVKEEPNDAWTGAGDDDGFDSVDSCEVKNFGAFTFHNSLANNTNEIMPSGEKIDEKIFIDVECQHVKSELTSPPTKICKTENENVPSIVKIENQIHTNYFVENSPMILIKKGR
ncbi:hypothetical protein TKK_0010587 [Trichogramma kaykai]